MAINYKIHDFPNLAIRGQVFYAGGFGYDGGFTTGGASMFSPEPGGRSYLEIELSLQTNEWDTPFSSWLMSKTNGEIFRIQLVKTPQLVKNSDLNINISNNVGIPWGQEGIFQNSPWDNNLNWLIDDVFVLPNSPSTEGETTIIADLSLFGQVIKIGHVIGHDNYSYKVDDIEYDNNNIATITVKPPLRKDIASGDFINLRPYFLGRISNGSEIRTMYEASNAGHIQLPRIIFSEVIINV